ncbi:sodium ion-translocating decarboxylase subunit beta [Salmonella enterica]|nr:sodium ion-translocating decarboxylase subunit beta [Salmonella enterica]
MENLALDMGYTPGVLALFYKVAIGSGVAPLVIFMGVGAMTDFGPLLANPRTLLGMFCFGNLMRESGVVERLSDTVQNGLINIVTIFLGLSVGAKLVADKFLQPQTLGILLLGVVAFGIGTAAGVLMAKLLNLCSKNKINPLIGSAGVSAVPMAARVSNKVGLESDPQNFLLMHAMGPNVAGVIGSAIAAGVMLKYVLAM